MQKFIVHNRSDSPDHMAVFLASEVLSKSKVKMMLGRHYYMNFNLCGSKYQAIYRLNKDSITIEIYGENNVY